ncbi:MAG: hypothetical protein AAGH15_00070 [Myxococcota bacterium]
MTQEPDKGENTLVYVLAGCGVLLVVGLCVIAGVGVWVISSSEELVPYHDPPPSTSPAPGFPAPSVPSSPGAPSAPALPSPGGKPPPSAQPSLPPPPQPVPIRGVEVEWEVEVVGGAARVTPGTRCTFNVLLRPRPDRGPWCQAEVRCGGQLLYGGGTAGFFECSFSDAGPDGPGAVVGGEDLTTEADGDAAFRIDTLGGVIDIRDDATSANGELSVRGRVVGVR